MIKKSSSSFHKAVIHKPFKEMIDIASKETPPHFFLLDEERFHFYRFDIYHTFEEKCTRTNLQTIVSHKLQEIKQNFGRHGQKLFYHIDTIFVNGEPKEYIVGETGIIFFRLSLVFLKSQDLHELTMRYGDINSWLCKIYPSSFFTINFLKQHIDKQNFYLLYILDNQTKLITVENWFYSSFQSLNRWAHMLKEIFDDNNVSQFLYKSQQEIDSSPYARELVMQSVDFYTNMLNKRLRTHIHTGQDIILITPLVKNGYFLETLQKRYNQYINGYILPFHYSNKLETYNRDRAPDEMDTLVFLNSDREVIQSLMS